MDVRSQISMVFHLDKCIGCHTCSIACKNIWTDRKGAEYMWWNNVETKPGTGYPTKWENQEIYKGGWGKKMGKVRLKGAGKAKGLLNIFHNPHLPVIDDYYEPFTYKYLNLIESPQSETQVTARPVSMITGKPIDIKMGPNWDDDLSGTPDFARNDPNFKNLSAGEQEAMFQLERMAMFYLPRICNHCLNPACVASCPSGALYKRGEDGIVLINQKKCRAWRMCVSACPYKKSYYNWNSGKSEKCTFCYPRIEAGDPTVCSETCVGRIRYLGVMLYDADRIGEAASASDKEDLYQSQLDIFLDPNDPAIIEQARKDGVPDSWIKAAQQSPVYKMAMEWKVAFPLHPEYRTLPMVWYIPPLSPIQDAAAKGKIASDGVIPDVSKLRIPVKYLANLLTAGKEEPVINGLERMIAMRAYMRARTVDGVNATEILDRVGLDEQTLDDMYRIMALANYEDRYVIPTNHREYAGETPFDNEIAFNHRSSCGFSFGNGCSDGISKTSLFGGPTHKNTMSGKPRPAKD